MNRKTRNAFKIKLRNRGIKVDRPMLAWTRLKGEAFIVSYMQYLFRLAIGGTSSTAGVSSTPYEGDPND